MNASSPFSESSSDFPSGKQQRRAKIDYSKFRTRICHHYQSGRCPFEDRCAFSHGDDSNPSIQIEASPRHPRRVKSDVLSDGHVSGSDSLSNGDLLPPPPPAYEIAVEDMQSDFSMMPQAYPPRFRYDPYSSSGIQEETDY